MSKRKIAELLPRALSARNSRWRPFNVTENRWKIRAAASLVSEVKMKRSQQETSGTPPTKKQALTKMIPPINIGAVSTEVSNNITYIVFWTRKFANKRVDKVQVITIRILQSWMLNLSSSVRGLWLAHRHHSCCRNETPQYFEHSNLKLNFTPTRLLFCFSLLYLPGWDEFEGPKIPK